MLINLMFFAFFIFIFFCVIIVFFNHFLLKNNTFCEKMKNLDVLIFSKQLKTKFIKLNKSHSNYVVLNMFLNQQKKLFIENEIYLNKNYLVVLSKIIDQKINSVKTTFRSKRGKIYIDEISKYIASLILTKDECLLFSEYKKDQI